MSDHPSELRQDPTAQEIRAAQVEEFRAAMQEAMGGMDPRQLEAAGDMAGPSTNERSEAQRRRLTSPAGICPCRCCGMEGKGLRLSFTPSLPPTHTRADA
jgi:hypothetical protein